MLLQRAIPTTALVIALSVAPVPGWAQEYHPSALTPERIATLPAAEKAAWQAYYDRSVAHLRQDQAALAAEVKAAGLNAPLPAPSGDGFRRGRRAENSWFLTEEGRRMADACISFQTPSGGWSKGVAFDKGNRQPGMHFTGSINGWYYVATFDNGAHNAPMLSLAKSYRATGEPKYLAAFNKGLDFIFDSQYPNGGWPQNYPLAHWYHDTITFNDDSMTNTVVLLQAIAAGRPEYDFVDDTRRAKARAAAESGLRCILKSQIVQDGKLTVWCAQHDPINLAAAPARKFEVASLSGGESANILRFLMSIENPSPEVKAAIEGAAAWFEAVKVTGYEVESSLNAVGGRVFTLKANPNAGPLWARFYELGTNRPIFVNREAKVFYSLADLDQSGPGNGYNWYVNAPQKILEQEYPKWKATWGQPKLFLGVP